MSVAIVTGSSGLIGSACVRALDALGLEVVGIDNDLRRYFFGPDASTRPVSGELIKSCARFRHCDLDIRNSNEIGRIFKQYGSRIGLLIHAAAQPSHDWAAREPLTDFEVNATGTLQLLEYTRQHCPAAVFIYVSTNKVYGDTPNTLPLHELETRWELDSTHRFHAHGIDESMSIDHSQHSLFGTSKLAADLLAQEYGRYFGLRTGIFRCGCVTGPQHAGAELHGFLAYLIKCAVAEREYRILGYRGKQVRDLIHGSDVAQAFIQFFRAPRPAEVYNLGGGRECHASLLEIIDAVGVRMNRPMRTTYRDEPRAGDHMWWVSDARKFASHYPSWKLTHALPDLLDEMLDRPHTLAP